jgi:hypothetical protein
MTVGILAALFACLTFGTSSVMQALGARKSQEAALARGDQGQETATGGPTWRATLAAMLTVAFIIGTVLDVLAFAGNAVAAKLAPLFLTQTIISANLVVTAVLGIFVLGIRLYARDWVAIAVVIIALGALGIAAKGEGHKQGTAVFHWLLFGLTVGFVLLSLGLIRWLGSKAAIVAGLAAGLLFGGVAIAVRILHGISHFDLGAIVADPALYTLVIAGAGGFYLHTVALQLGSVNGATAALVVGETVVPGIIGVIWLGDQADPGLRWLAILGFVFAVVGAVAVAWFGAAESDGHGGPVSEPPAEDDRVLVNGLDTAN